MDEKNLAILSELIKLARIDHNQRESEYELIIAIADILGVPQVRVDLLLNEYEEFDPPESEVDRITIFHQLCMVAGIDLEVNEKEVVHLKNMGIKLGLNYAAVDTVVDALKERKGKPLSPAELISIFKTHHN